MACRPSVLSLSCRCLKQNFDDNGFKLLRQSSSLWSLSNLNDIHHSTHCSNICAANTRLQLRRDFFSFPTVNSSLSRRKDYNGRKLVGFSMEEMFNVVADVGNYKNFVPFCKRSDVISKRENYLQGKLEIGFPPIVESYTSNVTLAKPHLVKAECVEGKLFDLLTTNWKFSPGLENKKSCVIDFSVSFEFKSLIHSQLAHMFFNELIRQMESAFFEEAKRRYGRPTLLTQNLRPVNLEINRKR